MGILLTIGVTSYPQENTGTQQTDGSFKYCYEALTTSQKLLVDGLKQCNIGAVRKEIAKLENVNFQFCDDDYPSNPLVYAIAQCGNLELVKLLLKYGADADIQLGHARITALTTAIREGYDDIAAYLIRNGANVNRCNYVGSPLYISLLERNLTIANLLLDKGASVDNECDGSVLDTAIRTANKDIVLKLIKHGSDVNSYGMTPPLITAVELELTEIVQILLEAGANPNLQGYLPTIIPSDSGQGEQGDRRTEAPAGIKNKTALHVATKMGLYRIARLLLAYGADATIKDAGGSTPCDIARNLCSPHEREKFARLLQCSNGHRVTGNSN